MSEQPEFHRHEAPDLLTKAKAAERLEQMNLWALQEIARADGLPVHEQRGYQIQTILNHWFPPDMDNPDRPMSFKEVLDMEELVPKGQRRVWRKKTWGKEMGF